MKTHKFRLSIKWHTNDDGGDIRTICFDYLDEKDKNIKKDKILNDFRKKPMDIGSKKGKIPYSVTTNTPNFKKW